MVSYKVAKEDWILTDQGAVSPEVLLAEPDSYGDLQNNNVLQDTSLLMLLLVMNVRGVPKGLDLYGERPYLQVPPVLGASLERKPLHSLNMMQATGRDVTLLTHTFDATPQVVDHAEVARILTAFQLFAPSRGNSVWNYTKDNPAARSVEFFALGETFKETLELNTHPLLAQEPAFWEVEPDWAMWRSGVDVPVTLGRAHVYPWRSIFLEAEEAGVRWIRHASGVSPLIDNMQMWPDPHTLAEVLEQDGKEKRKGAYDRLRNPQSREVYGALVQALSETLEGSDIVPLGFRHARERGASRVRAVGVVSRSGQPVVQNVAQAELPWPTAAHALEMLQVAKQGHDTAIQTVSHQMYLREQPVTFSEVYTSQLPHDYWSRLWPWLSLALVGELDFEGLYEAVQQTIRESAAAFLGVFSLEDELMSPFIRELLDLPSSFAADLQKAKPKAANVRHRIRLMKEAKGGDRHAREVMIELYGLHGLHGSGIPLMQVLATLQEGITVSDKEVQNLFGAQRHELGRLLCPVVERLYRHELPFDYQALYEDLIYYRPATWQRWQAEYEKTALQVKGVL